MGIKYLNRYLKSHCRKCITTEFVSKLKGKTIVFDTSIYLYRFLEVDALLENFFLLVSQCYKYEINPIFVFDGKPSVEKQPVLLERMNRRNEAQEELENCQIKLQQYSTEMSEEERIHLEKQMKQYKKESIKVTAKHIQQVRTLLQSLHVTCVDAPQEADILCAYYVNKNIAWACVSDDMDMFIYGCEHIIRSWDVEKEQFTLYKKNKILRTLNVDEKYFRCLLILLGTDYHEAIQQHEQFTISQSLEYYQQYTKMLNLNPNLNPNINLNPCVHFYNWLVCQGYLTSCNVEKLYRINSLFDISTVQSTTFPKVSDLGSSKEFIQWNLVHQMLKPLGFLF